MGRDKSQLIVDGSTLALRTASLLQLVVKTAVEVGPGVSGLRATREEPQGQGPLVAIAEGCRALRSLGHTGSALVVACDMPFLSEAFLRYLVEWPSSNSVVPVVQGRPQPLCAKWARGDLDAASQLVGQGVRSLKHLTTQTGVVLLDESAWRDVAAEEVFSDVDSPADLQRLGLTT
jgi:molybdopterin-guanine dinucleotide biosynthesis protein A